MAVLALSAGSAAAAHTTTYASKPATVSQLNHFTKLPHGIQLAPAFLACLGMIDLLPTGPCSVTSPDDAGPSPSGSPAAPVNVSGSGISGGSGTPGYNFNGVSDVLQRTQTGYHFTPPDQGLCIGPAGPLEGAGVPLGVSGATTVVVELVNDGWAVFTKTGQQLWLDSNADLFSDPNSSGDIECNYDQAAQTYYFTEIGYEPLVIGYLTNVAVLNAGGYSAWQIDTAEGGYCFPDFPHQGYDNNALYITINEFCGAGEDYAGANIYALSKSQLVNHQAPSGVYWALDDNYFSFRAATGGTNTEYLLASEQNDYTQNALDLAKVTGDSNLGSAVLSVATVPSESYTEPIPAVSTGNGTTCVYNFGAWCSIPEHYIDPVDMRLEQVQYDNGQLYTSLSTALTVGASPTIVDGVAWFQVDAASASVVHQGYVGVANTNLLMPSMVKASSGAFMLGFSMTGPTLNPSAGYMISTDLGNSFTPVSTAGAGSGPHVSFSTDEPGYMRARWGDYSRIAFDPTDGSVWTAQEYIPPNNQGGSDLVDNWGTRVWQACIGGTVSGDVKVGAGQILCLLPGAHVTHDVAVQKGGILIDSGATVDHDLKVDGGSSASITGGSVGHDLAVQNSTGAVTITGVTVAHDLTVQNNAGPTNVSGNHAGHDATCKKNGGQTGSGNTAGHNNTCPA